MITREVIEKQVILFCLNDKEIFLKYLNFLRSEEFNNEIYAEIYRRQTEQYKQKQTLHDKDFLIELIESERKDKSLNTNGIKDLSKELPKANSKNTIIDYMIKFVRDDRLLKSLTDCSLKVEDGSYTNEEIERSIRESLYISDSDDFGRSIFDFEGRIDNLRRAINEAIPSFSDKLNKNISRGYYPGELYVYMAAPGVGKSLALINEAFHALKQGKKRVYFTYELSQDRVGLRFDSLVGKKPMRDIFKNVEAIKQSYKNLKHITHQGDIIIKEYPTRGASVLDMSIFLDQLKIYQNFTPDIIYVDYGDIIKPEIQRKSEYEDQGEIFMSLRRLAIERKVPVITATQAQRDILNKKIEGVNIGQISDSFTIARIADGIYALIQTEKDKEINQMHLKIVKNRNGKTGEKITFTVYYENMQLQDSEI